MPYATFTAEDFCKDPGFIGWVTNPTPESNRFWQSFLREYPHKETDIQQAVDFVKSIRFQEINPSPQDLARLKQRIWNDIEPDRYTIGKVAESAGPRPGRIIQWYRRPYWAAAAVWLVVSMAGLGWWYQRIANLTYQTAFGTLQTVRLTDGSVVTLNVNSTLKVAPQLAENPIREVWLTGEAYFDIAKRRGTKFIVHTPQANIEVLGTEFNVNTRREQTNVVLHEGKVQLTADHASPVVMAPGDMATITPKSQQIQLKRVQTARHEAWTQSYLVLDGKSLPEIITSLEDTFGVTIELANAELANTQLTGKLNTKVADDCINNLALILDARVEKDGNTYRFR